MRPGILNKRTDTNRAKTQCFLRKRSSKGQTSSVRNRMLGHSFNRLMHRDLHRFRLNRGLDPAESPVIGNHTASDGHHMRWMEIG
jgi:hypothetical protein